jgi:menaquinone-dependent protoporphyrinogen oxidase
MTTSVLLAFHSQEGQTARISDRIASVMTREGATVTTASTSEDPSPTGYDGIVLGDSIHLGRHSRSLRRWITHHADALDDTPVALFQVSLTSAHDDAEHHDEAHQMLQRLLDATGLDPDIVGLFAGALAYTRYGWLKRKLMTRIAESQGDDTDTTQDHEYTDWDAVEHFAIDALSHFRASASGEPS